MTRIPNGMEMVRQMPLNQWFKIPDEVKRIYPDAPRWELNNYYNNVIRQLNRLAKWKDNVVKNGEGQLIYWCI